MKGGLLKLGWMGLSLGVLMGCEAMDVPLDQVPPAVLETAKKACPEGRIDEVSKERENGAVVYEIDMELGGGKECELEIAADGTLLKPKGCCGAPKLCADQEWNFETDQVGTVPKDWTVAETSGKGTPATWQVVKDAKGPCVAIVANENTGATYNLLLAEKSCYADLEISVMVKAMAGKEDQGGGPIWRAKDADNYYICRWNPLEDNLRVYYVKEGRRKQIASATVKADPTTWHEIEVEQEGSKIEVEFDGKDVIKVVDTTFTDPGMIGLWVKADGQSQFDHVEVEAK